MGAVGFSHDVSSVRSANGRKAQSWGDDLESLGYVFLYFARGSLPWQGLKAPNKKERRDLVKAMKANLSGEKLCEGLLPAEFATYINYARSLGFEDKPDYAAIRENFRRLSRSKGFEYDNVYDWTVSRFVEIHRSGDKMASSNPTEALEQRPTGGQQEEVQRVADSAAEDSKGDHKGVAGKAECPWTSPTC